MTMKRYRADLREALERLAAPAENQTKYLEKLLSYPLADELALDLHELLLLADEQLRSGVISESERDAATIVSAKLNEMSGQHLANLWSAEALSSTREWQDVRKLATHALELIRSGDEHR